MPPTFCEAKGFVLRNGVNAIFRAHIVRIFGIIRPSRRPDEHEMQILRQHELRLDVHPFTHAET